MSRETSPSERQRVNRRRTGLGLGAAAVSTAIASFFVGNRAPEPAPQAPVATTVTAATEKAPTTSAQPEVRISAISTEKINLPNEVVAADVTKMARKIDELYKAGAADSSLIVPLGDDPEGPVQLVQHFDAERGGRRTLSLTLPSPDADPSQATGLVIDVASSVSEEGVALGDVYQFQLSLSAGSYHGVVTRNGEQVPSFADAESYTHAFADANAIIERADNGDPIK